MSKPQILISHKKYEVPLDTLKFLLSVDDVVSYHKARDYRHPLGVYNISVSRICDKIEKCIDKLKKYWADEKDRYVHEEIIDYLELCMYAAAEHVDDVEEIAGIFFPNKLTASKSKHIKKLKQSIKPLRDEISNFTNTIKHQHGRLRLWHVKFNHQNESVPLIGFFIEGFKDGTAAPNPILHSDNKVVISITSFIWNILTYLSDMSGALVEFLKVLGLKPMESASIENNSFKRVVFKLAGLPLYSFDDDHPFNRITWKLELDEEMSKDANSGIYGSLLKPWTQSKNGSFSEHRTYYSGDGITRSFKLVQPKEIRILHWT